MVNCYNECRDHCPAPFSYFVRQKGYFHLFPLIMALYTFRLQQSKEVVVEVVKYLALWPTIKIRLVTKVSIFKSKHFTSEIKFYWIVTCKTRQCFWTLATGLWSRSSRERDWPCFWPLTVRNLIDLVRSANWGYAAEHLCKASKAFW